MPGCSSSFFSNNDLHVQALFLSLYKNFSNVLMERLPDPSRARTLRELKSIQADEMTVDLDESSVMEVDNESRRPNKRSLPTLPLFLLSFSFLCLLLSLHLLFISRAILFPSTLAVSRMEERTATSIMWERKSNGVYPLLAM